MTERKQKVDNKDNLEIQYSFMLGAKHADHIVALQQSTEKSMSVKTKVYFIFVASEKAYNKMIRFEPLRVCYLNMEWLTVGCDKS